MPKELTLTDLIFANLLSTPQIYFPASHGMDYGRFLTQSDAFTLAQASTVDVNIVNPEGYVTLLSHARVTANLPIVRFQVIKDGVIDLNDASFDEWNRELPNLYTPFHNSGVIRFINLSTISTPAVYYTLEMCQMTVEHWQMLYNILSGLSHSSMMTRMHGERDPDKGRHGYDRD